MAYSEYCAGPYAPSLLPPGTFGFAGGSSNSERVYFTAYKSMRIKGKKKKLIGAFDLSNRQNGFFVQKKDGLRLYIDSNNNGRFNKRRDALIGHFNRDKEDISMKHALPGNPAPSELRQGLSRMMLGEESYIRVIREKKFNINRRFFKNGRRERIDIHIDMEKSIDDAYFYKWGDVFRARTDFTTMNDGKPYSTGYYFVSGVGFECL